MRYPIYSIAIILLLFTANPTFWSNEPIWEHKVAPELLDQAANQEVEFLVYLHDQASLDAFRQRPAGIQKKQQLLKALRTTTQRTQAPLIDLIEAAGQPYRSFFIANVIYTKGTIDLITTLAKQEAVATIQPNPWTKLQEPEVHRSLIDLRDPLEWGIDTINAALVWELGNRGEGIVVGGQDTGVEWDHPALINQYRGWDGTTAEHNYNWHDAISEISLLHEDPVISPELNRCGLSTGIPCDDLFHGTYTISIAVGDDENGNQVGVAPGAKWIACRNMERGYGSPASYIECFEWFLAPTDTLGQNPDVAQAPHVLVNSWGCPEIEGCNPDNWALMEQVIETLRTSGIVVVNSAGNDGPGCNTISKPSAMFKNTLTVGSTTRQDEISGFSSRGLVTVDSSFRLKPNVVAPGSSIRAATLNGGYTTASGTSAAGPHVAGLVALMLSANPALIGEVDLVEDLVEQTAIPLFSNDTCNLVPGTAHPNPIFGYGRVDALAAVQAAMDVVSTTERLSANDQVLVFPNPVQSEAVFRVRENLTQLDVVLFDGVGRQVYEASDLGVVGGQCRVEIGHLSKGVYYFQIVADGAIWVGKLVKG
ncbi:MAG: S8 family peptidase [Bacteroidota bacterium]